jgi:hypothetical protein
VRIFGVMQVKDVGEGKLVEGFKDILRVKNFGRFFYFLFFNLGRSQRKMIYFPIFSPKKNYLIAFTFFFSLSLFSILIYILYLFNYFLFSVENFTRDSSK